MTQEWVSTHQSHRSTSACMTAWHKLLSTSPREASRHETTTPVRAQGPTRARPGAPPKGAISNMSNSQSSSNIPSTRQDLAYLQSQSDQILSTSHHPLSSSLPQPFYLLFYL